MIEIARTAGADIAGGEDILEKVSYLPTWKFSSSFSLSLCLSLSHTQLQSGGLDCEEFDVCLCSPAMYEKVKQFDRMLKAKTPSPRKGTSASANQSNTIIVCGRQWHSLASIQASFSQSPLGRVGGGERGSLVGGYEIVQFTSKL